MIRFSAALCSFRNYTHKTKLKQKQIIKQQLHLIDFLSASVWIGGWEIPFKNKKVHFPNSIYLNSDFQFYFSAHFPIRARFLWLFLSFLFLWIEVNLRTHKTEVMSIPNSACVTVYLYYRLNDLQFGWYSR